MKKEKIARFFWKILPRRIKDLLKFLWNLFPLEIERLDDFIVKVKESRKLVVVEKINEDAVVSDHEYRTRTVIGKRFAVELISFAANGKKIMYRAFFEFLPADIHEQVDEERNVALAQKIDYVARKISQYLTLKNIPVKTNN